MSRLTASRDETGEKCGSPHFSQSTCCVVASRALDCVSVGGILESSDLVRLRTERYASYDAGSGAAFERGELSLEDLAALASEFGEPELVSGKQELFESIVNRYIR